MDKSSTIAFCIGWLVITGAEAWEGYSTGDSMQLIESLVSGVVGVGLGVFWFYYNRKYPPTEFGE
jgi:hypothetical protein